MTTASRITMIRILLIPIFMFFFLTEFVPYSRYIALAIFIIASATDGVDGYVARKYNQITDFGKFIDPLADKILIASALICMVQFGWVSAVAVLIIIAREFMVTGLRIVAISSGSVLAATFSGKLKMVIQIVVIACIILAQDFIGLWAYFPITIEIAIWLMVIVTAYSGIEYMVKNWKVVDFNK